MRWWLLALAGCAPKVPEHLRLDEKPEEAPVAITDAASALKAVMGSDPLARTPRSPDPEQLAAVGAEPLADFVRTVRSIETGTEDLHRGLARLEDEHGDTAVLALSRGYQLRIAENQLLNTLLEPEEAQRQALELLTPLLPGVQDPGLPRQPLEFLGGAEGARHYGERWVLEAWLSSPSIPIEVPAEALNAPQYDDLRATATGRLIGARAGHAEADADAAFADLRRATTLALTRAAADRDAEQAAWSDQKHAVAEEVGDADPVGKLLERARDGLTANAGAERSAGGALLALAALRWVDRCDDAPCAGLDRVSQMGTAGRWDPELAPLARAWQVVALDDVLATLDAGRTTSLFPDAMTDLADALLGTGGLPVEVQALRKLHPDAGVWLTVGRSVGEEGATEWEAARVALGRHLERLATSAAASASEEDRPLLERIAKRAVP